MNYTRNTTPTKEEEDLEHRKQQIFQKKVRELEIADEKLRFAMSRSFTISNTILSSFKKT